MNTNQHPALVNAPKSRKEAAKRILDAFNNGELQTMGGCKYENSKGKPCAIGYLFTPEQREWLKRRGLNDVPIGSFLIQVGVGTKNVTAMTGMSIADCKAVQESFDQDKPNEFRNLLKSFGA